MSDAPPTPFDDWVRRLFDRPAAEWAWEWEDETPSPPPGEFIAHATVLFSHCGQVLAEYSDGQIANGLCRLTSTTLGDEMFALLDATIPLATRMACVRSILALNPEIFAKRCTPHLSHLDRHTTHSHVSPLNGPAYMWWDTFALWGDRDNPLADPLNRACIEVMEGSLAFSHIAVREGALHGLGHFGHGYPVECQAIIRRFLDSNPDLNPELARYAEAAFRQDVL